MPRTTTSGPRVRAGIELSGATLRYAEIATPARPIGADASGDSAPRLLRLGACDFDFDVEEALFEPDAPTHLSTVADALRDIFRDTTAERLGIAVHPWRATSFFAPLAAGTPAVEKLDLLRQEAAMLADVRVQRSQPITATPVRTQVRADGREYHWHHVLHVREAAQARLGHLGGAIRSGISITFQDSVGAAAEVAFAGRPAEEVEREIEDPAAASHRLVLGVYRRHVEFGILHGGEWHHGQALPSGDSADAAYFVLTSLDRLGVAPSMVTDLAIYGDGDGEVAGMLQDALGIEARPLSPMPLFASARSSADAKSLAAFAPCVGVALKV